MKINEEVVEEMKGELIEALIKINSYSEEDAIRYLEELKLTHESATKLLLAYREAQSAENMAKNVWDTILNRKVIADHSEVAEYRQKQDETSKRFEILKAKCALQIVINRIQPSEIHEELLDDINEKGVQESEIINPELKLHLYYHKQIDSIIERAGKISSAYKKQKEDWQIAYNNLEKEYQEKIDSDEKNYQLALAHIETLKEQLEQSRKRGVLNKIKHKLFSKKIKEIPDTIQELPKTLLPNDFVDKPKEMGMQQSNETINSRSNENVRDRADDEEEQR